MNLINKELLHGIVPEKCTNYGYGDSGNQEYLFRTVREKSAASGLEPEVAQQSGAAGVP